MERLTENMTCNDLKERWEWACGYLGKEHSRQRNFKYKGPGVCLEYVWNSKEARVDGAECEQGEHGRK